MMNIGTNPTVGGKDKSVEIHFLDFTGDLYGRYITVSVLHRLRDEQRFASVDDLKAQLKKDQEATFSYITAS
jgi:riboflavin kinase/FMN adenylyltransferase